jgi:hypothetical protein
MNINIGFLYEREHSGFHSPPFELDIPMLGMRSVGDCVASLPSEVLPVFQLALASRIHDRARASLHWHLFDEKHVTIAQQRIEFWPLVAEGSDETQPSHKQSCIHICISFMPMTLPGQKKVRPYQ